MSDGTYRLIEHTADFGVEAEGPTPADVFAAAARGMFAGVVDLDAVRPRHAWPVATSAPDLPLLLHAFLDELLYLHLTRRVLVADVADLTLEEPAPPHEGRVRATVLGEPIDPARHELRVEIKAVTLHGLRVERAGDRWRAAVIFDI